MAEYAGKGPQACWAAIHAAMPQAVLSGIIGDRAHTYGYHRGRNYVSGGDYSATQADDRAGPGEAASALDVSLNPNDMKIVTQRLIDAVNKNDPRLHCVREFYGTTTGTTVTGRDVRTKSVVTSDPSHLTHEHVSFYRRWADNPTECAKMAEVFLGKGTSGGTGDDPVPKEMRLYTSAAKKTSYKKGTWVTLGFDKYVKGTSGGFSACLPANASRFICTVDLTYTNLPPDQNAWIRIQNWDAATNKQTGLFPMAELRGTTGKTTLSYTRVGSLPAKRTYLRVLVTGTNDGVIEAADWRIQYW